MAEWQLQSAWSGYLPPPGRYGRAEGAPGVRIAQREGLSIATIVGRIDRGSPLLEGEGQGEVCDSSGESTHLTPTLSLQEREPVAPLGRGEYSEILAILATDLGLPPPEPRHASLAGERALVWSGPGQWLALAPGRDALRDLGPALAGLAAVTDQSDARAVLRLSGPSARDALAKGFALDLHPRAFPPGSAATTLVAHIGAQIWMVDDAPTYDIAVARSYAGSIWRWLAGASAAFGYVVEDGRP